MELSVLEIAYYRLMRHINNIYKRRIAYNMFEDILVKYVWSTVGMLLCAMPIIGDQMRYIVTGRDVPDDGKSTEELKEMLGHNANHLHVNRRLFDLDFLRLKFYRYMINMADAGGRLIYSYKHVAELSGYTLRVYQLISVMRSLHDGHYEKQMLPGTKYSLNKQDGLVEEVDDCVALKDVTLVTPNGEVLLKNLSMKVKRGEHLMITGPNGSGKSSIMRLVAGLWPLFDGVLQKPNDKDVLYMPQRPYLSLGSLREQ